MARLHSHLDLAFQFGMVILGSLFNAANAENFKPWANFMSMHLFSFAGIKIMDGMGSKEEEGL